MFPTVQTSPNAGALLSKAACLSYWTPAEVEAHARSMVRMARILSARLAQTLGPPVFGITESHLVVFDISAVAESGAAAEVALEQGRILVNRNLVPGDKRSPWETSGIRLGTAALSILQYSEEDVGALADAICSVLEGAARHHDVIARLLAVYHQPLISTASAPTDLAPMSSPRPRTAG
jgi:glycine hydroxymethyltransferase